MPTTFDTADETTLALARGVLEQFYPDLVELELTYGILMATAEKDEKTGEPKGPALKHHGWPAAAVIKINRYQDRVEGKPDVTIKIDAEWWANHSKKECAALLDHEFQHLMPRVDDEGNVIADDCGRPKLRMRPHDYEVTGFHAVIDRHGEDAAEVVEMRALAVSEGGQRLFRFMKPWG